MFSSSFEVKPKYRDRVEHLAMMCSTDIEDDVHELLNDKGWSSEIYHKFSSQVYHIISKYIKTYEEAKLCEADLKHMLKQKEDNEQGFLKIIEQKRFNFFDIVLKDTQVRFLNNVSLLKEIYKLRSDGIGLGEVFLTLFSECVSPSRGDIRVDDYIIELKGERGILGLEGYWNAYLAELRQKYNVNSNTKALNLFYKEPFACDMLYKLRTEQGDSKFESKLISDISHINKTLKNVNLPKLLLAIQIYTYHINNKFDKIIFINSDKALCIEYGSLKNIYKQVEPHNFLLNTCIQASRNKGLGVILKD